MKRPVSFFQYVHTRLNPFQIQLSLVVSLLVSLAFSGILISNQLRIDRELTAVLTPYLEGLINSQDRPEILRLIESVSGLEDRQVVIVEGERVLVSSRSVSEMDQTFIAPKFILHLFGADFSSSEIITRARIGLSLDSVETREIYLIRPILPVIFDALLAALLTFVFCFVVASFSAHKMKKAIRKAIQPFDQLRNEIAAIHRDEVLGSKPIAIRELEEIRQAIVLTKRDLSNAQDSLAEEKAKQLSSESYKRLIHDLHTPVSALSQMIKILTDEGKSSEDQSIALSSVPKIAEQILNQVSSARHNLAFQADQLREADLRDSVISSAEQVQLRSGKSKQLSLDIPSMPVLFDHDPQLIQRAVTNLVENAFHAARENVRLTLTPLNLGAVIRVEDDGSGIDEAKLSLYLLGKGRSDKADRPSFGLSSVNHIVRSHGGKVVYRKSPLGGASFEIRLRVL